MANGIIVSFLEGIYLDVKRKEIYQFYRNMHTYFNQ